MGGCASKPKVLEDKAKKAPPPESESNETGVPVKTHHVERERDIVVDKGKAIDKGKEIVEDDIFHKQSSTKRPSLSSFFEDTHSRHPSDHGIPPADSFKFRKSSLDQKPTDIFETKPKEPELTGTSVQQEARREAETPPYAKAEKRVEVALMPETVVEKENHEEKMMVEGKLTAGTQKPETPQEIEIVEEKPEIVAQRHETPAVKIAEREIESLPVKVVKKFKENEKDRPVVHTLKPEILEEKRELVPEDRATTSTQNLEMPQENLALGKEEVISNSYPPVEKAVIMTRNIETPKGKMTLEKEAAKDKSPVDKTVIVTQNLKTSEEKMSMEREVVEDKPPLEQATTTLKLDTPEEKSVIVTQNLETAEANRTLGKEVVKDEGHVVVTEDLETPGDKVALKKVIVNDTWPVKQVALEEGLITQIAASLAAENEAVKDESPVQQVTEEKEETVTEHIETPKEEVVKGKAPVQVEAEEKATMVTKDIEMPKENMAVEEEGVRDESPVQVEAEEKASMVTKDIETPKENMAVEEEGVKEESPVQVEAEEKATMVTKDIETPKENMAVEEEGVKDESPVQVEAEEAAPTLTQNIETPETLENEEDEHKSLVQQNLEMLEEKMMTQEEVVSYKQPIEKQSSETREEKKEVEELTSTTVETPEEKMKK